MFCSQCHWTKRHESTKEASSQTPLEHILTSKEIGEEEEEDLAELMAWLDNQPSSSRRSEQPQPLLTLHIELKMKIASIISPLELELKLLLKHLKYSFFFTT